MLTEPYLTQIARSIQLSVAPVFLLTAIGTTIVVLTNRLGRIVDRARTLEGRMASISAFIGVFLSLDLAVFVSLLFVTAMLVLIVALLAFLREIFIALKTLRIGTG